MAITYRILPEDEYETLYNYIREQSAPMHLPDPKCSVVIAVEDAGKLVGFCSAIALVHMGSEWIDPEYRKRFRIAPYMFGLTIQELKNRGVNFVAAVVDDQERGDMLERLGFVKLPGLLYGSTI